MQLNVFGCNGLKRVETAAQFRKFLVSTHLQRTGDTGRAFSFEKGWMW